MLEKYIYRNLERYGNCLISNSLLKKLGKTKILEDLKQHGLNCDIEVRKMTQKNKIKFVTEEIVIVEVKGW